MREKSTSFGGGPKMCHSCTCTILTSECCLRFSPTNFCILLVTIELIRSQLLIKKSSVNRNSLIIIKTIVASFIVLYVAFAYKVIF